MRRKEYALKKTEEKLATRQAFLEAIDNAPTPAQQRKALAAFLKERDLNPIEELVNLAQDKDVSKAQRIGIWKSIAEFVQPKLKSVDVSGNLSGDFTVQLVDFSGMTREDAERETRAARAKQAEPGDGYDEFVSGEDRLDPGGSRGDYPDDEENEPPESPEPDEPPENHGDEPG